MSNDLAAQAADFELYDAPLLFETDVDLDGNPLWARDVLLTIANLEAKKAEAVAVRDAIAERYDDTIARITDSIREARAQLEAYVTRFGTVGFPDAGGAHLTTRNKGGKLHVADSVVFEDYVKTSLPDVYEAASETVTRLDVKKALELVADELTIAATADGSLVDTEAGIIIENDLPGVEVLPEEKTLAVRKP